MNDALPTDAEERKKHPIYSGFISYFPHAIARVARLSYEGNQQHHPDKPLHWDKSKSADELDAMMRHTIDELDALARGDIEQALDEATRRAWRAMADLERKLTGCSGEKQSAQGDKTAVESCFVRHMEHLHHQ